MGSHDFRLVINHIDNVGMTRKIRYGDYLGHVRTRHVAISYNDVTAYDSQRRRRPRLRPLDIYRLIAPYVGVRFLEQFRAVIPVVAFLAVFQWLALQSQVQGALAITLGIGSVILGLMLFMEGLKHGLMPFSENIGHLMPVRFTLLPVLIVAFVLGVAATFAEPAIGALRSVGALTSREDAPLLYYLLNNNPESVVYTVAGSVGLAVLVSMLRFMRGWNLKYLLLPVVIPCLALTAYMASDPLLAPVVGLAWDCGAITTGPVTVPVVLALGVGVSAASGRENNPLDGFGIVTLASLFPPMAVMLLGLVAGEQGWHLAATQMETLSVVGDPAAGNALTNHALTESVLAALRAILPLTLLLWLVHEFWLREKIPQANLVRYGIVLCVLGMSAFNLGLSEGLNAMGVQVGNQLSTAFHADGALYPYWIGLALAFVFAAFLGFGATLAEPALSALGTTVQNLTDGALQKKTLVNSVAVGVGLGTAAGVAKVVFDLPLVWLLLPAYALALLLTLLSSEEYVNLAWDSAGVTTGPVTVPLVLAMGLGLGSAVDAVEGFGILAMASVGPIVTVLAVSQWIQIRDRLYRMQTGRAT
jgi:hypothetical protein